MELLLPRDFPLCDLVEQPRLCYAALKFRSGQSSRRNSVSVAHGWSGLFSNCGGSTKLEAPAASSGRAFVVEQPVQEDRLEPWWQGLSSDSTPCWEEKLGTQNLRHSDFSHNAAGTWIPGQDAGSSSEAGHEVKAGTLLQYCEQAEPGEAVAALDLLVQRGFHIDGSVFYRVLKRCMAQKDLDLGRRVHDLVVKSGYRSNAFLANHIIRMYASFGRLEEAKQVFTKVIAPNAHMWAAIILAHAQHGQPREAINLYGKMRNSTQRPDSYIFVAVLQACAIGMDLVSGKEVHADILRCANKPNVFVYNCLVDMYSKCGSLDDARQVFDSVPTRDVVTWNAMIAGYAQLGHGQEAIILYESMQQEAITTANRVTFVCLLQACAGVGALHHGKQLHAQIQQLGLEADVCVGNGLVNMYTKCRSLEDARTVFDGLPRRDVVTWTSMITGYVQLGRSQDALLLYDSMQQEGITSANHVTFVCLLQACSSIGALDHGKQVHEQICERGLEMDVVVGSCLVDMYAKCGSLEDAYRVFDKLTARNVVTWNSLIAGYVNHGLGREALSLYARMQLDSKVAANDVTFSCLLQACAAVGDLHQGKEIHAQIQRSGLEANVFVGSCLVNMYSKCGSIVDARRVFDRLPTRDVVTWTAIIAGYVQHGLGKDALDLYSRMQGDGLMPADVVTFVCLLQACAGVGAVHQGEQLHEQIEEQGLGSNLLIGNSLVDMYATFGSIEAARRVFDRLPAKDVVTWNAMIGGYVRNGLGQEGLALHACMQQESLTPVNQVTVACLLQACTSTGALQHGKDLHALIVERGMESDMAVGSCLVDMYAKCGSLEDARGVFDRWPTKDAVTWNALLNGYAEHGRGDEAMQLFAEMLQQGVEPDSATFVSLLAACSRAGLVHEGQVYFRMMVEEHGIAPTDYHFTCMVDLLGRSGRLAEAEKILETVPFGNYVAGWTSLLNACKSHGDVERGRRCFDRLIRLEPTNASPYVLWGNICANAGRWRDVDRVEKLRRTAGAEKKPARACIEVQNKVHEFRVGEERGDVSSKLRTMNWRWKHEGGHVAQTELVLKAVSEQHKEDALCGHAEKLALAYGLLNTADGTTLLVTKNLRMCNDCHNSTKIMSRVEKREIIVRDANRVHCFSDGRCSCGDRH